MKKFYALDSGNSFIVELYNCAIHSDKEILVAQYSHEYYYDFTTGDPMMMLVPATVHYTNEINLSTSSSSQYSNYINIIVLKEYYQPSMMYWITGGVKRSLQSHYWAPITWNNVTEAYYTQLSVPSGSIRIIHTSANALTAAVVYGFRHEGDMNCGHCAGSYGHSGGLDIQNKIQG